VTELNHSYLAKEREKTTTAYHHHGRTVCRNTFLFLHGVGSCHLKAIKYHYLANGLVPRRHGNTGRVPSNALSLEDVQHVVHFILHYAEAFAILLPGHIPGYKRDDVQLLPCSTTRRSVVAKTGMQKLTHSLWLSSLCNLAVEHEVVNCYYFFPQYLAWRVMVGLNQLVTISFLLVRHTKFSPDWCFGPFKQRFRRTFVSSLQEIADVVESSADVNAACGHPRRKDDCTSL